MKWAKMKNTIATLLYHDRMTVSRQEAAVDAEGADDYKVTEVYKDIPCKLGIYEISLTGDKTDRGVELKQNLRVDCDPSYLILANDILTVTHGGKEFVLMAGKPFLYDTHQEINVSRVREEA